MNQWGSIVALTYIAAQRTFPDYNDMADNKVYLESIARSFGYFYGKDKKVRINTISRHGVYSRFHHVNILDALRDTPADHYEVITCLDALVYVGDLAPVIPNVLRCRRGGI